MWPNVVVASGSSTTGSSSSTSSLFSVEQREALTGFTGNIKISDDRLTGEFDNKLWIIVTGDTNLVSGNAYYLT